MTRVFAIVGTLVAVALVAFVYVVILSPGDDDQFAQCRASVVAGGTAEIGGPFTLVSETGETVTDQDLIDRPTLIYFGFTNCDTVCSIDAARNAVAIDVLAEKGIDVRPLFISFDHERDTPEILKNYTDIIHPAMIGLTGSEEQIKDVTRSYRTFHSKMDADDEFYQFEHTTFSYLTLPEHGFLEFFRREETPEAIAERVACFVEAA
ncbi:MAG: SCO family protein [Pseudomonadota bacterium]